MAANAGPEVSLPSDGVLRIAFDRPLLPSTVTRQAIFVRDASGVPVAAPIVRYDPVAKVISVASPSLESRVWLEPGRPYVVSVTGEPGDGEPDYALRALDGAPLAPDDPRRRFAFFAGPATNAPREAEASFCDHVLPLLRARCAGSACHGDERPAAGLALTTAEGIRATAVDRVAREANVGPRAGAPRAPGRTFGADMPLVSPGNAGDSYLLYKLLLGDNAESTAPTAARPRCDGDAGAPPPFAPPAVGWARWSPEDRAALGAVVPGHEMPYPFWDGQRVLRDQHLRDAELQLVRAWIDQGARVYACDACAR